tara:strand:- start:11610 stop:11966 length:357 start_codon:yes stop_codon:yes gene_type:complete
MEYIKHIKPQDFLIQVRPDITNKNRWTGGVNINILSSNSNPLRATDNKQVYNLCCMMASMIPFLEMYPDLAAEVHDLAHEYGSIDTIKNKDTKKELTVVSKEGNLIKIDFKTETEGSA